MNYPRFLLLAPVAAAFLFSGCNNSDSSAETEELKRRLDQLEQEKREAAEKEQAATKEELAKARDQLALALEALEKEQLKPEVKGPEVDVNGAPRAVVVDETSPSDPKVGLKLSELPTDPDVGEDYRVFYRELSKHGEWFGSDDYGYMWQPREARADRTWRPYTRGRWMNSEQGWTWFSEEPFGWATYHHGRWALLERHGWAWVPGDQWAPAWVSWRQSDEYIGWAPLPPETMYGAGPQFDAQVDTTYDLAPSWYSFVPIGKFDRPVAANCVPRESVMQIVVHTENVTRIERRRDGVFCGGPDPGWVARQSGRQFSRGTVERRSERLAGGVEQRIQGNRLEVFAPPVQAPWNSAVRPQRVAGSWGRISVVRGGGAMDPAALERYRGEMLARNEAARRAMLQEEVRQALVRERLAREEAARQAAARCQPASHRQLEAAFQAADAEYEAASERLAQRGLSASQRAQAEAALKRADQRYHEAEEAYASHMIEFHPEEWERSEGERLRAEAQRQAREEQRRQMVCQPSEHERLEGNYQAALREARVTTQAIEEGNLNPRQLAYARMRLGNANKHLATAERAYMEHLLKHHPDEYRAIIADQARGEAERELLDERRRTEALAREEAKRAAEEARRRAEAEAETTRRTEREAEARAQAEAETREARRVAEEQRRLAEEGAKGEAAERARMEARRLAEAEAAARTKAEAEAAARAEAEARAKAEVQERAEKAELEARRLAEERAKAEAAERAKMEAQRLAEAEAEAKAKVEAETAARAAAEAKEEEERAQAEARRLAAAEAKAEAEKARRDAQLLALEQAKAEAVKAAAEKAKELERREAERAAAEAEAKARTQAEAETEKRTRDQGADRKPGVPEGCVPAVHEQLEARLKAAKLAAEAAQAKLESPGLNPKQAAFARKALGNAMTALKSAQSGWEAHLAEHHPAEWQQILADRAAAAKKAERERRR